MVIQEHDQESTSPSTDSGPVSRPSWSMSPEEGIGGGFNLNDAHIDFEEILQSTAKAQQQRDHQMRWGPQLQQQRQAQPSGLAAPLLPMRHGDDPTNIDDLECAASASSLFPWTTNANTIGPPPLSASGTPPFSAASSFTPMVPNCTTSISQHSYHQTQPDFSGMIGLRNNSSHGSDDTDMGGFVVPGLDAGHFHSLLLQRAKSLGECSPGGSVSLQGEGCDREVLNYLLDVLLPVRHLVKIDVNM
jgi:hypothetical protein